MIPTSVAGVDEETVWGRPVFLSSTFSKANIMQSKIPPGLYSQIESSQ